MAIINTSSSKESLCNFRVIQKDGIHNICLLHSEKIILTSPAEGLWSMATGWSDNWPEQWQHVNPESIEDKAFRGDFWTILTRI